MKLASALAEVDKASFSRDPARLYHQHGGPASGYSGLQPLRTLYLSKGRASLKDWLTFRPCGRVGKKKKLARQNQ